MLARIIIPWGLGLLCSCAMQRSPSGEALLPPGLPPEQVLDEQAGGKNQLILTLHLSDGQAVPCLVDTGTSLTTLDWSLKGSLGRRLGTEHVQAPLKPVGIEKAGIYTAPKLYLGNVPLMTGPTVLAGPVIETNSPCKAVLGMDCLRHYCIQLDFEEHKMRFLDSNTLKREELGLAFPLILTTNNGWVPLVDVTWATNGNVRFMVDTGFAGGLTDLTLPPALVRPAFQSHAAVGTPMFLTFSSDTANQVFLFPNVVLGSETYQKVRVAQLGIKCAQGAYLDGFMTLPFLARHTVTFDFPHQRMYLRQRRPETGKEAQSFGAPGTLPNKITGANAGGLYCFPSRTRWAARIAQF